MKEIDISPIINVEELMLLKSSSENRLVIVDASGNTDAWNNYQSLHLEGAVFVDVNLHLAKSAHNPAMGGRHPLPDIAMFSELLMSIGITKKSHIVIYDNHFGGNAAARFWWMLRSVGHQKVQVLNGGFQEALQKGFPTSSVVKPIHSLEPYEVIDWQLPQSSITEVEEVVLDENYVVIDVRDNIRYRGEKEPIDLIAGHIPGAINIPYLENLDVKGLFLAPQKLKEKYEKTLCGIPAENVIVHCGSGITACHTLLAMCYAGFKVPKLYVGSWSEWSRNGKSIGTIVLKD